jgi:hypothetical protein
MLLRMAWLVALVMAAPAQAGWQDTPDSLPLGKLGDSLVVNGVPMQIRNFVTTAPMEQVLEDVRVSWERHPDRTSVTRTKVGDWTVLNQRVGQRHRSLQVRQAEGGLEGYVALTSPGEKREPRLSVRLPAAMTAMSVIDSVDGSTVSQQVIAVSKRSPDATAAALEETMKAQGWKRHVLQRTGSGVLFAANRGEQQFDANISKQKQGALVMMNTIVRNK